MQIEDYERTYDQNEDLGLNDMNTDDYQGKPLQFRPGKAKACCPRSQMIQDIAQAGKHLITRETPGGTTCQTSPNLQSTRKSTSDFPSSPAMTATRSATPDQGSKQWQFISRLLLFAFLIAFLIIFVIAWSYMLCSMDSECRPFGDTSDTGNGSLFKKWPIFGVLVNDANHSKL